MNKPNRQRKTHFEGRYLSLLEIESWEYCSRCNATGVVILIAVTDKDELLLVEQFRIPVNSHVIELPAGLVGDTNEPDESIIQAAKRELFEETGYSAEHFEVMMSCPSSAGMSDEIITFVMAKNLTRTGAGGGDASEDITVHKIPLGQVESWLDHQRQNEIMIDPKIFSALYWQGQTRDR